MAGTLRLFTAMKDLYIFTKFAPYIAPILQQLRIRRGKTLAVRP